MSGFLLFAAAALFVAVPALAYFWAERAQERRARDILRRMGWKGPRP